METGDNKSKYLEQGMSDNEKANYFTTIKMYIMKKSFLFLLLSVFSVSTLLAQVQISSQRPRKIKCGTNTYDLLTGGIDTAQKRGMADNYYMWDNGSPILVKFMGGGSQLMRNKVMAFAKEWEQYANIKFQFLPDNAGATNIRLKLGGYYDGLGHNSYVGTYCNLISPNEQTMNLDTSDFIDVDYYLDDLKKGGSFYTYLKNKGTDFKSYTMEKLINDVLNSPNVVWNYTSMKGTVLHEFGHALGLLHEQSYPGGIKWNKSDSVYDYYKPWSREKVDAQVFSVGDQFYTNGTAYDPKSIMQYAVESWQTVDGFSVDRNNALSEGDKKLIAALYPKDKKVSTREVPKVTVTNMTKIDVVQGTTKQGISIYPSFDLKTNSQLGRVILVAMLNYEEGGKQYHFYATNKNYNYGGYLASTLQMNLLPNTKMSYNKTNKNLELFLPYSQIPSSLKGKDVTFEFMVVLDDLKNGQLSKLMYYDSTSPLSIAN